MRIKQDRRDQGVAEYVQKTREEAAAKSREKDSSGYFSLGGNSTGAFLLHREGHGWREKDDATERALLRRAAAGESGAKKLQETFPLHRVGRGWRENNDAKERALLREYSSASGQKHGGQIQIRTHGHDDESNQDQNRQSRGHAASGLGGGFFVGNVPL